MSALRGPIVRQREAFSVHRPDRISVAPHRGPPKARISIDYTCRWLPDERFGGAHDLQSVKRVFANLASIAFFRTSANKRQRYRVTSAEAAVTADATIQTGLVSARR